MQKKAILINDKDNVATLTEEIKKGDSVRVVGAEEEIALTANENIPFGHKIALRKIQENERVKKYGEDIGVAEKPIKIGSHVHTHNLKTLRCLVKID
ncbi:hypothetical protein AKJ61_02725 [candidate division MSBL1 archaeon SCGC-AAA259B11]|uniref:SAF domain-containing protein n=1 Tax=candidate division MSBL1 archaeon SCGC-AAA259B11 TaxID=1698260 RepID=A0A133U5Q4_9EURY|nr:hypothetical protein AKJ61_02725 [candidate division MSBL1 archaeon SCGC-AAA259B11]